MTSFWWIQARRGRLRAFRPNSFSGYLKAGTAAIRLPPPVFNSGAVPIVITDLRLWLRPPEGHPLLLHCRSFRKSLRPETEDIEDFAYPWCIPGRTVIAKHVEFASLAPPQSLLSGAPVIAVIEALQDQEDVWRQLLSFELHVEIMAHTGRYITYSNQPHVWQAGLRELAVAAFAQLRAEIASR